MIRLRREGKRGQASRGDVGSAPASSPLPLHGAAGASEGAATPIGSPRDYLDEVDEAVALAAYEKWISL